MKPTSEAIQISVVIPVYKGEKTLESVISEILPFTTTQRTNQGHEFQITEIILVHDCGPDESDLMIEKLSKMHSVVKPIWLTRNFGQHAATMAGMARSKGAWVVTMDEDGQQDPVYFSKLLDTALESSYQVVYAQPINSPPHGFVRNTLSTAAKNVANWLLHSSQAVKFNSYRLVEGEVARTLAAYCSNGVYLDVGLHWIAGRIGNCSVELRNEFGRPSGYSYIRLFAHFWNLVISTGTKPLRLITGVGFCSMILAIFISIYAIYAKIYLNNTVPGWTSMLIVVSFFSGTTLTAIGIIAEYLALTMGIVMGKPLYVIASKPTRSARNT